MRAAEEGVRGLTANIVINIIISSRALRGCTAARTSLYRTGSPV